MTCSLRPEMSLTSVFSLVLSRLFLLYIICLVCHLYFVILCLFLSHQVFLQCFVVLQQKLKTNIKNRKEKVFKVENDTTDTNFLSPPSKPNSSWFDVGIHVLLSYLLSPLNLVSAVVWIRQVFRVHCCFSLFYIWGPWCCSVTETGAFLLLILVPHWVQERWKLPVYVTRGDCCHAHVFIFSIDLSTCNSCLTFSAEV